MHFLNNTIKIKFGYLQNNTFSKAIEFPLNYRFNAFSRDIFYLLHENKMENIMRLIIAFITILSLTACTSTTQLTSGSSYLAQYRHIPASSNNTYDTGIEEKIRKVAAVEPTLKFPARIGLARIENGRLTTIPQSEARAWQKTQKKLGKQFGQFVPVNPLIAEMVADSTQSSHAYRPTVHNVMNKIRLGAARQHLDLVLIYETLNKNNRHSNILAIADLTIIGGFILPSNNIQIEGVANAILIDVIQGYPYGTTNAVLKKEEVHLSTWGSAGREREYSKTVRNKAVLKLTEKVENLLRRLKKRTTSEAPCQTILPIERSSLQSAPEVISLLIPISLQHSVIHKRKIQHITMT